MSDSWSLEIGEEAVGGWAYKLSIWNTDNCADNSSEPIIVLLFLTSPLETTVRS